MNEEDFACDNCAPQKWRKDVCRNCFQPQRLHEKKQRKPSIKSAEKKGGSEATNVNTNPKAEPKVFKRYRQQRDFVLCTAMALLSASVHSTTLAMTNSYCHSKKGTNLIGHTMIIICMHIMTRPFLFDGLQYQFYCYEVQMSICLLISVYLSVYCC